MENDLDVAGSLSNDGTLSFDGDESSVSIGTMDVDSGLVTYVGDLNGTDDAPTIFDFGAVDYYDLQINDADGTATDTYTAGAGLSVANDFTLTDGGFNAVAETVNIDGNLVIAAAGTFTASSGTASLAGDFTNSGTFNDNGGEFSFDNAVAASTQTITGDVTFEDLDVSSDDVSRTLVIADGDTVTVNGVANISGDTESAPTACVNILSLHATTTSTLNSSAILIAAGNANAGTIQCLDVDSVEQTASPDVNIVSPSGSSIVTADGWTLGYTISGIVRDAEGSTSASMNGLTVALQLDGGTDSGVSLFSTTTANDAAGTLEAGANDGEFLFSGIDLDSTATLIVFLDDETEDGVTVALDNNLDITGLDIIQDYLSLEHENAGPITTTNINTADGTPDTDVTAIFTTDGTDLTTLAGKDLLVGAGESFTPSGALTAAGDVHIDGTYTNSSNGAISITGNWEDTGTYTAGTETVTFNGTAAQTVTSNGSSFNDVRITNTSASVSSADALNVAGTLTIDDAATFDVDDQDFSIGTLVNNTNTSGGLELYGTQSTRTITTMDVDSGNVTYTGDNGGTAVTLIDFAIGTADYFNLTVNSTDSTASTFSKATDELEVAGNFVITDGAVDMNGQALTTTGNLQIDGGSFDGDTAGMDLDGDMVINGGVLTATSGTLDLAGDILTGAAGTFTHNSGTVVLDKNTAHTIEGYVSGNLQFNNLTLVDDDNGGTNTILTLEQAKIFEINSTLTLTGGDSDDLIELNSSAGGNTTTIDFSGGSSSVSASFVTLRDHVATSTGGNQNLPIQPASSLETVSDTTTGWFIGISGALSDSAGTLITTADRTITVYLNGEDIGSDTTDGSGVYSVTYLDGLNPGDVILAFEDDEATRAAAMTVYAAATGNVDDLDLKEDTLYIEHDGDGTVTSQNFIDAGDFDDTFLTTPIDTDYTDLFTVTTDANEDIVVLTGKNLEIEAGATLAPNNDLTLGGDFTNLGAFTHSDTLTFNGAAAQVVDMGSSAVASTVVLSGAGTDVQLSGNGLNNAANALTIGTGSILSLDGENLNNTGTFTNNGELRLQGGETVVVTMDTANGTVTFEGDASGTNETYTIGDLASTFNNLTLNDVDGTDSDTFDIGAALTVNNDFTVTDGEFDSSGQTVNVTNDATIGTAGLWTAGASAINLTGDWINAAGSSGFAFGTSTMTFAANLSHSLTGATKFYNLTMEDTIDDATEITLTFEESTLTEIENTFTLNGADNVGDYLNIVSSNPPNAATVDFAGAGSSFSGANVRITDNTATSTGANQSLPVNVTNGVNGTNAGGWFASISGTAFDTSSTGIATVTIQAVLNGAVDLGLDTTSAGGAYNIPLGASLSSGDIVTVYIDDASLPDYNAVTVVRASGDNVTANLYENEVHLVSDDGNDVTHTDLQTADNLDVGAGSTDDITSLYTFSTNDIDYAGGFRIASGDTYNPGANAVNVAGDVTNDGTFTHTGSLIFDGATTQTVNMGATAIGSAVSTSGVATNVDLSGTAFNTSSTLTIAAGTVFDLQGQDLTVGSTFTNSGTLQLIGTESYAGTFATTGVTEFTGDGDAAGDTYTLTDFQTTYFDLSINATDAADEFDLGAALTLNNGLIIAEGILDQNGANAINVTSNITQTGGSFTGGSATIDVGNNVILSAGSFQSTSGQLQLAGDFTNTAATFTHNNGELELDDDLSHTISGDSTFYDVTLQDVTVDSTQITLTLGDGSTTTIANDLDIDGANGTTDQLLLRSVTGGVTATIDFASPATFSGSQLDIQDNTATTSSANVTLPINPTLSANNGNTGGWFATISGTALDVQGGTGLATKLVRAIKNGTDDLGMATTSGTGAFTIDPSTAFVAGDVITVYIDGETEQAVGVIVAGGGAVSITLVQDTLTVQDDNAGAITTANLATADGTGDTDISDLYTEDGSGNLTLGTGVDLQVESGSTYAPGGDITLSGDLDIEGSFTDGTDAITFNGGGVQTLTSNTSELYDVQVSTASTQLQLVDALTVANSLTIDANTTVDLVANDLTSSGTMTNNGTIQAQGSETITGLDATAGTVVLYGDGTAAATTHILSDLATAYYNLDVNDVDGTNDDSYQMNGAVTVTNDLNLTDGTLDTNSQGLDVNGAFVLGAAGAVTFGASAVTMAGAFTNNGGSFTQGTSTVTLDGGDQTVIGSSTFYNLTKAVADGTVTDPTLTFESGATTSIVNILTLDGFDGDDILTVDATIGGTEHNIDFTGTSRWSGDILATNGDFLDITDNYALDNSSNIVRPLNPDNSTDSGNAQGWFGATISGVVYLADGATTASDGEVVRILVNGDDRGNTATLAAGDGTYSVVDVNYTVGDVLTAYLDDGSTDDAVTVTLGGVQNGAITDLDLFFDHLITRHENAGPLTAANLDTANNADTDITAIYADGSGSLTIANSAELLVPTGYTFTPGVAIDASGTLDVDGTLTMATNTVNLEGDFDIAGSFSATNPAAVTFDGSGAQSYNNAATLGTVGVMAGSGTLTFNSTFDLTGSTFTQSGGTIACNSQDVNVDVFNQTAGTWAGCDSAMVTVTSNFAILGSYTAGSGETLNITGGLQTLGTFNGGDATITAGGNLDVDLGSFTSTSGPLTAGNLDITNPTTFNHNNGTIVVNGTSGTVRASGQTLNNLTVNPGVGNTATLTEAGTTNTGIDIDGDLTISFGTLDVSAANCNSDSAACNVNLAGDFLNSGAFTAQTGTVTLDGAADQTLSGTTIFNDFVAEVDGGTRNIVFPAGVTTTISNNTTLNGDSAGAGGATACTAGEYLGINSSAASEANLNILNTGTRITDCLTVDFVKQTNATDVALTARLGSSVSNVIDPTGWIIGGTISGVVYLADGSTTASDGEVVRVLVDGVDLSLTDTLSSGDGTYSISGVPYTSNQMITAYLDNDGGNQGVTVTEGLNSNTDIGNVDIYISHLRVQDETATGITNDELYTAGRIASTPDTDLTAIYSVSSASGGTLSTTTGTELLINTGDALTSGGPIDLGGSLDIDGTLDAAANAVNVGGDFDVTGTFTHTAGTVLTLDGAAAQDFTHAAALVSDVIVDKSAGTVTLQTALNNGSNNLTVTNGDLAANGQNVTTTLFTLTADSFTGIGAASFTADELQQDGGTFTAGSGGIDLGTGGLDLNSGSFTSTSGSLTSEGAVDIEAAVTFAAGGGTLELDGSTAATLSTGGQTLNSVRVNKSAAVAVSLDEQGAATTGVDITGDLTVTGSGSLDVSTAGCNSGASACDLRIGGSFTSTAGGFVEQTGTVTFSGTGTQLIDNPSDFNNLVVTKTAGEAQLSGNALTTANTTLSNATSVLDLNGENFTVSSTFTNDGTLQLQGGETVSLTNDTDSGIVEFQGAGGSVTRDVNAFSNTYFDLSINDTAGSDTFQATAALTVDGDLNVTDGSMDLNGQSIDLNEDMVIAAAGAVTAGAATVTLAGGFTNNSVSFDAGTSTVTLDGDDQVLAGNTAFASLIKNALTGGSTITFESGSTTTIDTALTLDGASGDILTIDASAATAATIDFQSGATFTGDFLAVSENTAVDNSGGSLTFPLNPASSTNDGLTTGWFPDITGTIYDGDPANGGLAITSGLDVGLLIDGTDSGLTATSDVNGDFLISGVTSASGQVMTVFISGETENAAQVTLSNGSGFAADLYQDMLLVGSKSGTAITNDELYEGGDFGGAALADITALYSVDGPTNGEVSTQAGVDLFVVASEEYAPGGDLDLAGSLYIDGTVTMAAETINIAGDFELDALGTFTANTSTASFDGAATQNITSSSNAFADIVFNSTGGAITLIDDLSAADITHTLGTFDPNAQNITATASYTMAAGSVSASTGDYDIDGNMILNGGVFNESTGTSTVAGNFNTSGGGSYTKNSSGTLEFDGASGSIYNNTGAINNLTVSKSSGALLFDSSADIDGNFSHTGAGDSDMNGQTVDIEGNFSVSDGNVTAGGAATVTLAGDWTNSVGAGGFTASSSSVTLDGNNQSLTGHTTFATLSKTEASGGSTITFQSGSITTINTALTLDGASANILTIAASAATVASLRFPNRG